MKVFYTFLQKKLKFICVYRKKNVPLREFYTYTYEKNGE